MRQGRCDHYQNKPYGREYAGHTLFFYSVWLVYWRAMRILGGSVCGWLVRKGLMSRPPRRVYLA